VASPTSPSDETKLDPNTLSLISAASAQVKATSTKACFSFSPAGTSNLYKIAHSLSAGPPRNYPNCSVKLIKRQTQRASTSARIFYG
jgi:hypothetical protein